jgi:hypothetical protein
MGNIRRLSEANKCTVRHGRLCQASRGRGGGSNGGRARGRWQTDYSSAIMILLGLWWNCRDSSPPVDFVAMFFAKTVSQR